MANYQNDPARRKQARYAKKAKQRRRNRRLVLAALVLALAAAAGWFFLNSGEEPGETTPPPVQTTAPPETSPAGTEPPKPQTGTTVIHIAAAGDLNVTDYVLENAAHENGYDFSQAFQDVGPILSAADLTLLNFEGTLAGEPYGTKRGSAPLALARQLAEKLPSYMLPNRWVKLDRLPMTINDKIDRVTLKKTYIGG